VQLKKLKFVPVPPVDEIVDLVLLVNVVEKVKN
jgi:hypothetical protein